MRNPGQDAGKGWSVVRLDGQSVGSAAGVADVASVARSATAAGQRVAIVVSSLRVQREKSVVDRLVHAASHCLAASGSPRSRPRNTTHHLSTKPICPHTRLLSQLERDLVQLIRRAIRGGQHSAILGQDAELFVADSVARLREFLAAIEIVGELSPTSMDSLIAAGDAMTAYIVTAALQSMGLPAKLIQTNDLMSSNHSYEVMDDHFFDQVVSNLSELISQQVINDAQNVIPIFTGSFGPLPSHLSLSVHFPTKTHTSLVASLLTLAFQPYSSTPPDLYLLHTHISGIYSVDPRVGANPPSRKARNIPLSAALELCSVGENDGLLCSTALELICTSDSASAGLILLARVSDLATPPATDFRRHAISSATRIYHDTHATSDPDSSDVRSIVISRTRVALLRLDGARDAHKLLGSTFRALDACGVQVALCSSSQGSIAVAVLDDLPARTSSTGTPPIGSGGQNTGMERAATRLRDLAPVGARVSLVRGKAIVSLVRTRVTEDTGMEEGAMRLLESLAGTGIHFDMCARGCGAVGVSVVVDEERVIEAVRAVAAGFAES